MMMQSFDVDLEDGELSNVSSDDDDVYTPLQRPLSSNTTISCPLPAVVKTVSPLTTCHQMQTALDEDNDSQADSSSESSSGESSDACLKRSVDGTKQKKRVRRTVMVRVDQTNDKAAPEKRSRFKKYNVWTEALQEEALTENMRGCDVTQSGCRDRNVENYDYSLRYRINGENCLKRRISNSTDDLSDGESHSQAKRGRCDSNEKLQRISVKNRLGYRYGRRGSSPTSESNNSYEPRVINDLEMVADRDLLDVAREMASKLFEEKDDLFVRIVEVLGIDLPMELFKETQRIEADGGMMIKNGMRRRTPGGIFLFLLKNHERITDEQQKSIFAEEKQNFTKRTNKIKSKSRDRKVEELKKRLSEQEKELPALSTRKDHYLLGSELCAENQAGNLSNPPPSPVGQDQSPEYKTHAINHVAPIASCSEKPTTSTSVETSYSSAFKEIADYDDDFLDVNCGDMDLF